MGYLQTFILDYLRGAGVRTNAQICDAVSREYLVSRNHINVTLARMVCLGLVERKRVGLYAVSQQGIARTCDRLLVSGVLDRLEADYADAFAHELQTRGWVKQ